MDKRSNNYLVTIALLLVVVIIIGTPLIHQTRSDSCENENHETAQSTAYTEASQTVEETDDRNFTTESPSVGSDEPACGGLQANTVTMDQIEILENGEYRYTKDGKVASRKGIDVSKYQKTIDWDLVAADGVEYAFVRVGCRGYGKNGTLILDEMFHQNVQGALAQGIEVGAYFFTQATTEEEAVQETELILEALKGYHITYPVAIDVERIENVQARQDALTAEERTALCKIFCEKMKEAGYIPLIYGNSETFSELLIPEELAEYDFWICETGGSMTFPYEFAVWQYSHKGKVSGISTNANFSICIKEW